jgi:hypothetical protein
VVRTLEAKGSRAAPVDEEAPDVRCGTTAEAVVGGVLGEPDKVVRDSGRGTEDVVVADVERGMRSAWLVAGGAS